MSTLTEFEPFVDSTIHNMFTQLNGFVAKGKDCDIARWLQYCMTQISCRPLPFLTQYPDAFDVIGELTFSKPLGFLEKGHDVDGIIASLEKMLDYSGKVMCDSGFPVGFLLKAYGDMYLDWSNAVA